MINACSMSEVTIVIDINKQFNTRACFALLCFYACLTIWTTRTAFIIFLVISLFAMWNTSEMLCSAPQRDHEEGYGILNIMGWNFKFFGHENLKNCLMKYRSFRFCSIYARTIHTWIQPDCVMIVLDVCMQNSWLLNAVRCILSIPDDKGMPILHH